MTPSDRFSQTGDLKRPNENFNWSIVIRLHIPNVLRVINLRALSGTQLHQVNASLIVSLGGKSVPYPMLREVHLKLACCRIWFTPQPFKGCYKMNVDQYCVIQSDISP